MEMSRYLPVLIVVIAATGFFFNWELLSTIATPTRSSEADSFSPSRRDQSEEKLEQKTKGLHSEGDALSGPPHSPTELVASFEEKPTPIISPDHDEVAAARPLRTDARAPWDPISGGGRGHALIERRCRAEIETLRCQNMLPLDKCLQTRLNTTSSNADTDRMLSKRCSSVLYPCLLGQPKTRECKQKKKYDNLLTDAETKHAENLLALIDQASMMSDVPPRQLDYWMTAGSMIGGLTHHGRIPWDDDIDIWVRQEHMDPLLRNVESLGLSVVWLNGGKWGEINRTCKIFNSSLPKIPRERHSYPFVDLFPVNCSDGILCIEENCHKKYNASIASIFPLKRRPFGRLSMPFPVKARSILENRYGVAFKEVCKKDAYNHRLESFRRKSRYAMNCSDMILPPPFVSDQYDAGVHTEQDTPGALVHVPWEEDFPNLAVEHFLNDAGQRLSSVLFEDGNEVRRSYADGLLELDGRVITYSFPDLRPHAQKNLLPFLYEERLSFLSNWAQRTTKELNLEVMPTLDRVVISNSYGTPVLGVGHSTDSSSDSKVLRVGEWNAERGANWDIFPTFYPNSDIIILNEMDWGMARSGNIDTTKEMANHMKMNYAYGVEFMELTNGNGREINDTVGQSNLIGYHGNVVMTRWPIIESRILRLHPLYDLLFEEKTSGQAKGERRLGGRMALFTLIRTDTIGDVLAISVHTHSGSKKQFLKDDATLICKETQKYSTTNVIIGGDIASPIPEVLVSACGFFPLEKTNSQKGGKGSRLTPSWKVGKCLTFLCLLFSFDSSCADNVFTQIFLLASVS